MTKDKFWKLKEGDHIRHVNGKDAYIITHTIFDTRIEMPPRHIATRTIDVTNPREWEKIEVKL